MAARLDGRAGSHARECGYLAEWCTSYRVSDVQARDNLCVRPSIPRHPDVHSHQFFRLPFLRFGVTPHSHVGGHSPYFSEALRLVQLRRFCVAPNEGFQAQLHEYEPIYRAELMQRRFADASRGEEYGSDPPPKRGYDETDDMDDMDGECGEYEHEHRNPATFPIPESVVPLPGHSAHVHHDGGGRFAREQGSSMEPA
jgi:hypothetical protein